MVKKTVVKVPEGWEGIAKRIVSVAREVEVEYDDQEYDPIEKIAENMNVSEDKLRKAIRHIVYNSVEIEIDGEE